MRSGRSLWPPAQPHGALRCRRNGLQRGLHEPGGSPAAAAGLAPIGFGSDLGGSIRVPAAFCGVCGLRSGTGRIPETSVLQSGDWTPVTDRMGAVGPLARTVEDLEPDRSVLAGAHPSDPESVPAAAPSPARAFHEADALAAAGAVLDALGRVEFAACAAPLEAAG